MPLPESKQVVFKKSAQERIKEGIDTVCNSISKTLGPKGRNAFIDREMQPIITNDGTTIANSIFLKGKLENMGAWLVKNTSAKTNDDAGDGTSTTAVLLQSIINEAEKRPESPVDIKRSLLEQGEKIEEWIKGVSAKVKEEQIESVATISAESPRVGKLIAEVIKKVGDRVPVYIEDSHIPDIEYSVAEGLETKVGYAHELFKNNDKEGLAELENVAVFATDKRIGSLPEIKKLLEMIQTEGITSLVLLASDVDKSVMANFIMAKQTGQFQPLIITATATNLEDMAYASGATLFSDSSGLKFDDVKKEHLGLAKRITATDKKTTIISNQGEKTKAGIDWLRISAKNTKNPYEAQRLDERADALEGGVAVIRVGATTDSEREYLKFKIEDAVNATKSAIDEGLVEGGGMCLYRMSNKIKGNSIGEEILRKALKEPLKAIIENAGEDYTTIIKKLPSDKGYDANTDSIVDMIESGIVDPTKVVRSAFKNAVSTASTYITMEVAIAEHDNQEKQDHPAMANVPPMMR